MVSCTTENGIDLQILYMFKGWHFILSNDLSVPPGGTFQRMFMISYLDDEILVSVGVQFPCYHLACFLCIMLYSTIHSCLKKMSGFQSYAG